MTALSQINLYKSPDFREAVSKVVRELLTERLTEFVIQRKGELRDIVLIERLL